jgi:8-amino-7-oxononanoate synthase
VGFRGGPDGRVVESMNPFSEPLRELREQDRLRALYPLDALNGLSGLPGKFVTREGRRCLNLSSNDYLGLSGHPRVKQAAADAALAHGAGSGGSRLLGGGLPLHLELEAEVARLRPLGKALLFNTGFMANLGVIQALAPLLGPVFSDKLNHASVAEALRTGSGPFHRYRHRDMAHLESLLKTHLDAAALPGLVCSETLFSMDGDFAPLRELLALQARYGFYLYLDEAHSTGCYPDLTGEALLAGLGDGPGAGRILIMGTFGKAYGGFGAYVAGPPDAIDYLVNAARSFIFSTALPPAVAGAALEAIRTAEAEPWRRARLAENAAFARGRFRARGFDLGANRAALRLSEALYHAGYHAPPVRHPTVPEGRARLRINLTCDIERAEIESLADEVSSALDESANEAGDG